jgi:hypothetical protein
VTGQDKTVRTVSVVADELAHFLATDEALAAGEALLHARLLDRLRSMGLDDPGVIRGLAANPGEMGRLWRIVDAACFADNPEPDEQARLQGVLAGLQTVRALSGGLGAAQAGTASGEARRAAAAARDARIRKLWAGLDQNLSERRRAQIVRNRIGRYPPSRATIMRAVESGRK